MIAVRYAPSPTGLQHIGGLRTALFNYLFARSQNARFILRIEDTDRKRYSQDAMDDIYQSLQWLGIEWEEGPDKGGEYGPYLQSERLSLYQDKIQELIKTGTAYTSREENEHGEETEVVRLRMPESGSISVSDILLGDITFQYADLPSDPVLMKSDGFPTYHFAHVVDDHLMQVSHVLRSQEWVSSVGIHALIYHSFAWEPPVFCHLPFVCASDGKKLSKRHGAVSVQDFRKLGYLPSALCNYLSLLGWSYDGVREEFLLSELIELFTLKGLNKSPAVFDSDRLNWYNRLYIRKTSSDELFSLLKPIISRDADFAHLDADGWEKIHKTMPLLQERLTTLNEAADMLRFIVSRRAAFQQGEDYIPKKMDADTVIRILSAVEELISSSADLDNPEALESEMRSWAQDAHISVRQLFMTLRLAICWSLVSLPLLPTFPLLGKEECLYRISSARQKIEKGA